IFFFLSFLVSGFAYTRDLHSFPTRRSSDLHDHNSSGFYAAPHECRFVRRRKTSYRQLHFDFGGSQRPKCKTHRQSDNQGHYQARSESTRLNSSHVKISYAVFCLKKKKKTKT